MSTESSAASEENEDVGLTSNIDASGTNAATGDGLSTEQQVEIKNCELMDTDSESLLGSDVEDLADTANHCERDIKLAAGVQRLFDDVRSGRLVHPNLDHPVRPNLAALQPPQI